MKIYDAPKLSMYSTASSAYNSKSFTNGINTNTHTHTYTHTLSHMHAHTRTHTYTHTHACARARAQTHEHIHGKILAQRKIRQRNRSTRLEM